MVLWGLCFRSEALQMSVLRRVKLMLSWLKKWTTETTKSLSMKSLIDGQKLPEKQKNATNLSRIKYFEGWEAVVFSYLFCSSATFSFE